MKEKLESLAAYIGNKLPHLTGFPKRSHSKKAICSVTVGKNKLPDMTPEMQLQVLQSALFTFDLMESVLAGVEELIEVKLKAASEEKIGSC